MNSQKILPLNQRLDNLQILELEGFKSRGNYGDSKYSTFMNPNISLQDLLLKYHKALLESEKEIEELEEKFSDLKDEIIDRIKDI